LITFQTSKIFEASADGAAAKIGSSQKLAQAKNWLKPKTKPSLKSLAKLSLSISEIRSVQLLSVILTIRDTFMALFTFKKPFFRHLAFEL